MSKQTFVPSLDSHSLCLFSHADRIYFMRYRAHGDTPFTINFRLIPSMDHDRVLHVNVRDTDSIHSVKAHLSTEYKIPVMSQRILLQNKLLDDSKTVGEYKVSLRTTEIAR